MWISVVGAFTYAVFSVVKHITDTSKKSSSCSSSGCCGSCGCDAKRSLVKQLKHKNINTFKPLTNS